MLISVVVAGISDSKASLLACKGMYKSRVGRVEQGEKWPWLVPLMPGTHHFVFNRQSSPASHSTNWNSEIQPKAELRPQYVQSFHHVEPGGDRGGSPGR